MYPLVLIDPTSPFGSTTRAPAEDVLALQSYATSGPADPCEHSMMSCISHPSCLSQTSTVVPTLPLES